jgi:hypothetical protein
VTTTAKLPKRDQTRRAVLPLYALTVFGLLVFFPATYVSMEARYPGSGVNIIAAIGLGFILSGLGAYVLGVRRRDTLLRAHAAERVDGKNGAVSQKQSSLPLGWALTLAPAVAMIASQLMSRNGSASANDALVLGVLYVLVVFSGVTLGVLS